jgi:hypothetical protein
MNKQEIEKANETIQDIHDVARSRIKSGDTRGVIYIPQDKLADLETTVNILTAQLTNGWIPVSERLPKENDLCQGDRILVTTSTGHVLCIAYDVNINRFYSEPHTFDVIAWQPLPGPFNQQSTASE